MSDNNEDDFDLDNDQGFDEFEEESSTLGRVIQENPLAKVGIIFAVAAVIFGVIILFGGGEEEQPFSMQGPGASVDSVPGTGEITPAMREAFTEVNQRNEEIARREGTSSIPIPIDPPVGVLQKAPTEEEREDPLQRWRRLQQERLDRELQNREVVQPATVPQDTGRDQAIASLAELMASQMQSILEQQGQMKWQTMTISDHNYLEQTVNNNDNTETPDSDDNEILEEIVLPAGEIAYAQLITEANSDVPGPVIAQIVSGPLKGSRVLGSFDTNNDLISLEFNTVVIDGESHSISAVAIDPDTTLPGMATDVDHRYFRRIALPMAAAFVEGAASAIAESGRTTVTISGEAVAEEEEETTDEQEIASGIEEAGGELRDILDDMADVETLVIIASGTPMGILFLEPVTKPIEDNDI